MRSEHSAENDAPWCPECGLESDYCGCALTLEEPTPNAEKDAPCTHPWWVEEGDGHGHNSWRCTTCGHSQWIAPWVLGTPIPPEGGQ